MLAKHAKYHRGLMMCASQQGVKFKKPKGCIPCLIEGECCCDCERVYAWHLLLWAAV